MSRSISGYRRLSAGIIVATAGLIFLECSHLRQAPGQEHRVIQAVLARAEALGGIRARGAVTAEFGGSLVTGQFDLRLSSNGSMEIRIQPTGAGLLISKQVTIESAGEDIVISTEDGEFLMSVPRISSPALHAFVFSLGGGEMLLRWLEGQKCEPAVSMVCDSLSIRLTVDTTRDVVSAWTIEDGRGGEIRMVVDRFAGNSYLLPQVISGLIYPYGIVFGIDYEEISTF